MSITRREVENVNLVKWIVRHAFALKDQRLAIGGEVSLAAPFSFEDQLASVGKELGLVAVLACIGAEIVQYQLQGRNSKHCRLKFHVTIIGPHCLPAQMTSTRGFLSRGRRLG